MQKISQTKAFLQKNKFSLILKLKEKNSVYFTKVWIKMEDIFLSKITQKREKFDNC